MQLVRRSLVRSIVLGVALVVVVAGPAAADPAAPTNYRSTVRSIDPASAAVSASVVGGDAFLEISVERGHEVVVSGYDDEPYLRIDRDGTVEENQRSPAVFLNQARYGRIDSDSSADAKAEPQWKRVGSGGQYAWHDHRIHWMSRGAPPPQLGGASSGAVFTWTVPVQIDGAASAINGDLYLQSAPSKLPYVALGVAAFAAFAALMWWQRRSTAFVLAACALAAFVLTLADQQSIPAVAGRQFSLYVTPAIAMVCALAAALRPRSTYAMVLRIAAIVVLPLWIVRSLSVLSNSVLPGDVSPAAMRVALVLAVAAVAAALVIDVRRDLSNLAPLDDDPVPAT